MRELGHQATTSEQEFAQAWPRCEVSRECNDITFAPLDRSHRRHVNVTQANVNMQLFHCNKRVMTSVWCLRNHTMTLRDTIIVLTHTISEWSWFGLPFGWVLSKPASVVTSFPSCSLVASSCVTDQLCKLHRWPLRCWHYHELILCCDGCSQRDHLVKRGLSLSYLHSRLCDWVDLEWERTINNLILKDVSTYMSCTHRTFVPWR